MLALRQECVCVYENLWMESFKLEKHEALTQSLLRSLAPPTLPKLIYSGPSTASHGVITTQKQDVWERAERNW